MNDNCLGINTECLATPIDSSSSTPSPESPFIHIEEHEYPSNASTIAFKLLQESQISHSVLSKQQLTTRYLTAARSLYENQYQSKRPNAVTRMTPNKFGLRTASTFDTLAGLQSPLRLKQVLDDWTPLEIGIFEDAFERFGKTFHVIAQQIPTKTCRDVVAFYYCWKKYGHLSYRNQPLYTDDNENLSFLSEPEPDICFETQQKVELLHQRQIQLRNYYDAARGLYCQAIRQRKQMQQFPSIDYGLSKPFFLKPVASAVSPLRVPTTIDCWTPFEIRVFELTIEIFGKEFAHVARMIPRKSTQDVIAFYYIWKKDPIYRSVKIKMRRRATIQYAYGVQHTTTKSN